jgi:hypothetical protein
MDWAQFSWIAGGSGLIAFGIFLLVSRRARGRIARSIWDFHAPIMDRVPWLYGPKPLRDWWFGEAGTRRQIVVFAIVAILIGVGWVFLSATE